MFLPNLTAKRNGAASQTGLPQTARNNLARAQAAPPFGQSRMRTARRVIPAVIAVLLAACDMDGSSSWESKDGGIVYKGVITGNLLEDGTLTPREVLRVTDFTYRKNGTVSFRMNVNGTRIYPTPSRSFEVTVSDPYGNDKGFTARPDESIITVTAGDALTDLLFLEIPLTFTMDIESEREISGICRFTFTPEDFPAAYRTL